MSDEENTNALGRPERLENLIFVKIYKKIQMLFKASKRILYYIKSIPMLPEHFWMLRKNRYRII